ncbi:hypothetical protein ACH5RR_009421 [Cinchona calisaya]|uniref:Uncharacterized protein n=1 Tax=Cinchona calisaya TaxID=153742 RepID=A0ABD3AED8_9GENT
MHTSLWSPTNPRACRSKIRLLASIFLKPLLLVECLRALMPFLLGHSSQIVSWAIELLESTVSFGSPSTCLCGVVTSRPLEKFLKLCSFSKLFFFYTDWKNEFREKGTRIW